MACDPTLQPQSDHLPVVFKLPHLKSPNSERSRIAVTLQPDRETLWYDVTSLPKGALTMHYAVDVNAVVRGEVAQRNFVQTLTKTFAQLSIGLAIFDRKRDLTLFNPALTDLTNLPAEFLAKRPSFNAFFDHLREVQMMPEPRDYKTWRQELSALAYAAEDGRYLETWSLPSGVTYRVSGRPHPDGALAFLIEDISAEVSLARRFRADLEMNRAVINQIDQPMIVFSSGGLMRLCNAAYGEFWKVDVDRSFSEVTLLDCVRMWQDRSEPQPGWDDLALRTATKGASALNGHSIIMEGGMNMMIWTHRIANGAVLVQFAAPNTPQGLLTLAQPSVASEE